MQNDTIRVFIALELADPVHQKAVDFLAKVRSETPQGIIRWVKPDGLHLTLKFLGDIPWAQVEPIASGLVTVAKSFTPMQITLKDLGAFPNVRKPRVIWVGIQSENTLSQLQAAVERMAGSLGFPPEERRFSPHLTLGRIRQEAPGDALNRLAAWLTASQHIDLGTCQASVMRLYRSELKPVGSVYTPLAEVKL